MPKRAVVLNELPFCKKVLGTNEAVSAFNAQEDVPSKEPVIDEPLIIEAVILPINKFALKELVGRLASAAVLAAFATEVAEFAVA